MLTKISLALNKPPKQLDRASAWACLTTNLLVLPGLGSLVAGRRIGFVQAFLALAGIILMNYWLFCFLRDWYQTKTFVLDLGPQKWCAIIGSLLLLIAWMWSFVTSIQTVREARINEKTRL